MWGCFFLVVVATLLSVNSETQIVEFVVPERVGGQSIRNSNLWWKGRNNAILGSPVGAYGVSDTVILGTTPCEPGKHWSRSRQICVDSYGLMNAGGNSKRSGERYATGRRLPTRQKRCTKPKPEEKCLTCGIPPHRPSRPPSPPFPPGIIGRKK